MWFGGNDQGECLMRGRSFLTRRITGKTELAEIFNLPGRRDRPEHIRCIIAAIVKSRNHVFDSNIDIGLIAFAPALDGRLPARIWSERRAGEDHLNRVSQVGYGYRAAASIAAR